MPPPMALLPLSSTSASASAALPHFRPCPPAALQLRVPSPSHSLSARPRAVSAGYAASFYGGSAMSAAGGADEEEVGDESGFGTGLGLGGGGLGMSAAEAALALEEREMPPCASTRPWSCSAPTCPKRSASPSSSATRSCSSPAAPCTLRSSFNRGVIPLAYSIRKRNSRTGLPSTYYDGIYLLITYFTKPESMDALQRRLNADDDVIRSTSFKVRQRKAV